MSSNGANIAPEHAHQCTPISAAADAAATSPATDSQLTFPSVNNSGVMSPPPLDVMVASEAQTADPAGLGPESASSAAAAARH